MARKKSTASCCSPGAGGESGCRIEGLVSVDDRGQMVLPKELRDRIGIRSGDKLALVSWYKDGEVCCLTLIRANQLEERVRDFLGPVIGGTTAG